MPPVTALAPEPSRLGAEIAALSGEFAQLSERLEEAGRRLKSPGAALPNDLAGALAQVQQRFEEIRAQVRNTNGTCASPLTTINDLNAWHTRHTEPPPPIVEPVAPEPTPVPIPAPESILPQAPAPPPPPVAPPTPAAAPQPETAIANAGAEVLDRVLRLVHTGPGDLPALGECQQTAAALRETLDSAAEEALTQGDHPFAQLLTFIERRDSLTDNAWATHYEAISATFGRPLAQAASRGRLRVT